MNGESAKDRRVQTDPRQRPTSVWDAFRLRGRRCYHRRAGDRLQPYFVDRFSSSLFILILILLLTTIADGVMTLYLLDCGCEEMNPVMAFALRRGLGTFFLCKYLLTVAGLPLLLIFKNHFLFSTRLRVGHLIPTFVVLYIILLSYQAYLFDWLFCG